jgi:acyl dehydratase
MVTPPEGRVFNAREERFGRYFDEFEVGDRFEHWPGKTVTDAENQIFCLLTMSVSPVHNDAVYAAEEMEAGRNLIVGTYVYALLLGMSVPEISGKAIANLGVENLRHLKPTFAGDTLYAHSTVMGRRPSRSRPQQGILTVETTGRNQRGEVVCQFTRSVLLPCRTKGGRA